MIGGYKGYYNGFTLDSSYEYIYCKILEFCNIKYKVHEKTYQLNGRQYTPDFFIYNELEELVEVIEIRGRRLNIEERIIDVAELKSILNIPVKLITEKDLNELCKINKLSYNKLKKSWRESPNTKKNFNKGEFNAMYGLHQAQKTKDEIGRLAKERMENKEYRNNITSKLIASNRANGFYHTKLPRSKRVTSICDYCGCEFIITKAESNHRKYCSQTCVTNHGRGLREATKAIIQNKINQNEAIKLYVLEFRDGHQSEINNIKMNKITTDETFNKLLKDIELNFNVVDLRTICEAVIGKHGRKEMIIFLKTPQ